LEIRNDFPLLLVEFLDEVVVLFLGRQRLLVQLLLVRRRLLVLFGIVPPAGCRQRQQ